MATPFDARRALHERRVLILAPTGRDAQLAREVFAENGVRSAVCESLDALVEEMGRGVGALLVSEEALRTQVQLHYLGDRLSRQPTWSDLPVLLLAHPGADSSAVRQAVRALGNVTLLERPVRVAALMTAVQTALRARQRQYNAREHLSDLDLIAKALRGSEARLKALFNTAAVGIGELTVSGRFALVNDALCALLGTSRDELVTLTLSHVTHRDDAPRVEAIMGKVLSGESETGSGEMRLIRRDGEQIWGNVSISLARVAEESGVHAVAVIEDITERKNAEEDLREADRRKDEFLATLAHELRNPLAPIRNSLHIFRLAGIQDPNIARVTTMMERQVGHMVRMVDDLLEVSRISRGKIELRRERVELAAVLRNAVDTSLPLIEAARHKLTVDVPSEPLLVDADPVRLAQVFSNLLNNAAKYTPEGGRIDVKVGIDGGMASVCVKDNGEGIPPAMLGRVFNMFTQVNTGSRAQGGLGIGLTLARTLVHLHGGSIEAASEGSGQGCEFLVRLPLAQSQSAMLPQPLPLESQRDTLALRRVLVVDDNEDAADSLGLLLQFLGAEVKVVHSGAAALQELAAFQPSVVLLDIGMPGMNGLEVARRMREDPNARDCTIVALTGWGQREDRRRTREAGFDYHLVKPADVGALQSILSLQRAEAATHH